MIKLKKSKPKKILSRAAYRRMHLPKKPRQGLVKVGKSNIKVGTSLAEKRWLDKLCVPERSKVIHGFNGKLIVVDGFNSVTRTVYEYNGSWCHGSHKLYTKNRDVVIPFLKKSPNQMYNETKARYQFLKDMGFKVFFVWDFQDKQGMLGRYYQGRYDTLY